MTEMKPNEMGKKQEMTTKNRTQPIRYPPKKMILFAFRLSKYFGVPSAFPLPKFRPVDFDQSIINLPTISFPLTPPFDSNTLKTKQNKTNSPPKLKS
jgi:hypothetical protein